MDRSGFGTHIGRAIQAMRIGCQTLFCVRSRSIWLSMCIEVGNEDARLDVFVLHLPLSSRGIEPSAECTESMRGRAASPPSGGKSITPNKASACGQRIVYGIHCWASTGGERTLQ